MVLGAEEAEVLDFVGASLGEFFSVVDFEVFFIGASVSGLGVGVFALVFCAEEDEALDGQRDVAGAFFCGRGFWRGG